MPHRRLRAGQVVRRRPRGQGRRVHRRRPRTGVDAEPSWSRRPPLERASLGIAFVGAVRRGAVIDVRRSLRDSYERWDGKGPSVRGRKRPGGPCCWRSCWPDPEPAGAGCTSGPPGKPSGAAGVSAATPRPAMFRPPLNQPCRTEASYHGLGVRLFAGHMGRVRRELRLAGGFASKGGSPSGPGHDSGGWRRRLRGHAASMDPTLFVGALVQVRQSRDGTLVRMHG